MKEKAIAPFRSRSPFSLMRRLSDDMERMFQDFDVRPFALLAPVSQEYDWLPAVEIFEKDNVLVVRADLPGLTAKDVTLEITDQLLTIQGERKQEREEKGEGFITTERSYGSFLRQIALPEGVTTEAAKATFKDGVLEIRVPVMAKKPTGARTLPIEEPEKALAGV
jgi:HSP20 family protein